MVLFSIELHNNIYYLVITTNLIDNNIFKLIQPTVKNVMFKFPITKINKYNKTFNFQVSIFSWSHFTNNIINLKFVGILIDKQFTEKHLIYMKNLNVIYN